MSTPDGLMQDLREVGIEAEDIWDLVDRVSDYGAAIPVLLDWLTNLESRAPEKDRPRLQEGLVRALTVSAARPAAAPALVREFRRTEDSTGLGNRWVIGNALAVVADDSMFDELDELIRDRSYGRARQMLVAGLGRSTDPRAVELLISMLKDDEVAAHALTALARLKPPGVRAHVEPLLGHGNLLVRREAKKAMAKLP
ncbi:MAG: hypothetical protein GEU96_15555 [Propionibacteriales bacterium]|nr:hypothetical protein [Propionibacteriales bacterium]